LFLMLRISIPAVNLAKAWDWNGSCILRLSFIKQFLHHGTGKRHHFDQYREHFPHHQKISLFGSRDFSA
jgi:hypothetical protein